MKRPHGLVVGAGCLLVLELGLRLAVRGPYVGATALLLASSGLALLTFAPSELGRASLRLAALPAVGIASFAILLTTVAIVGVPLTDVSIRIAVTALVAGGLAVDQLVEGDTERRDPHTSSRRRETGALALLALFVFLAGAIGWDISGPFPSRGTDWGHYLLYAHEVEAERALLLEDRLGSDGRIFADSPGVGALVGGPLILDGLESQSMSIVVTVVSALGLLGVYAFIGALWGSWAGLAATAVYSVAPIRLEPLYWYGLHTLLALTLVPLVLLALGLLYRGRRDRRTIGLLGFSLAGIAVAHTTSALVVGVFVGTVLVMGIAVAAVRRVLLQGDRNCVSASSGVLRPVTMAVGVACLVGAGVVVHLVRQSRELGEPVSYVFFEPDWLDVEAVVGYYSWAFLALVAIAAVVVLATSSLRRDPALLVVPALLLACVVASQLWRVHFPFEYRRVVYYAGLALVVLIAVAATRLRRHSWAVAAFTVVLVFMAHGSIGLRLPERLLLGSDEPSDRPKVEALLDLRRALDRKGFEGAVVADRCLHFVVPYLLRRPTLAAFEEWQVGFVNRLPTARRAGTVLAGGPAGERLAKRLGVGYVVVDPRCTQDPVPGLGGEPVVSRPDLVVIRLPGT